MTFLKKILKSEIRVFNFAVPNAVENTNDSTVVSSTCDDGSNMPAIRKKERDYEGMFEFRKEDINIIIRHLVIGEFQILLLVLCKKKFTKLPQKQCTL